MAINLNGTTGITTTGLTSNGIDDNATSTAMTLDSSGNLLVGTTSANTNGITLNSGDYIYASRNGGQALFVNRDTSDGPLIDLRFGGSAVGSIGTGSGVMAIAGPSGNGLSFPNNLVLPSTSTAGAKDASTDLGVSYSRFKDLYLSGGVYLGGTGSANKLDDYESGTFIPTFQSITNPTYVVRVGYYIKIGSFVSYQYRIEWSAGTSIGSTVNGLPFAARNGQDEYPMTSNVYHDQGVTYSSSRTTAIGYVLKNTANMDLVCIGSAQTVGSLTFSTSGSIYVTGQYYTNS